MPVTIRDEIIRKIPDPIPRIFVGVGRPLSKKEMEELCRLPGVHSAYKCANNHIGVCLSTEGAREKIKEELRKRFP
jgi:hypothetical protein